MSREVQTLEQDAKALTVSVVALVVDSPERFTEAGTMARLIAAYIQRVGAVMDPIVAAAHKAHTVAIAQRDALLKPATGAKRILADRMAAYEQLEAQRRREAEEVQRRERERLEAQARAEAEAETRRLQAEAEAQRLAEAAAMEARGDHAAAERLIAEPVTVEPVAPVPIFKPEPPVAKAPTAEGISFRDTWSAEVVDLAALVRAVAAGEAPLSVLAANQTALNGLARSLKDAFRMPGVRAVRERTMATRA